MGTNESGPTNLSSYHEMKRYEREITNLWKNRSQTPSGGKFDCMASSYRWPVWVLLIPNRSFYQTRRLASSDEVEILKYAVKSRSLVFVNPNVARTIITAQRNLFRHFIRRAISLPQQSLFWRSEWEALIKTINNCFGMGVDELNLLFTRE